MLVPNAILRYGVLMEKQWIILKPEKKKVQIIKRHFNCSDTIANILVNRGFDIKETAEAFLFPSFQQIKDPFSLNGMKTAVKRIHRALLKKEKILIFGDYDVDGVTASAALFNFLEYAGGDVSCYIPHRISEGYGFQPGSLSRIKGNQFRLLITVDCGSTSFDAVKKANKCGIDVIITDHHNVPEKGLDAAAVINPKKNNCPAGLEHLAGVGVVYFLLIALRKYLRDNGWWATRKEPNLKDYCDLVALGTISDIVPLYKENRIFTKAGIAVLNNGKRPGIKALISRCIKNGTIKTAQEIAFTLAPRLNAAGRMDHGKIAFALLTEKIPEKADQLAKTLCLLNRKRRDIEDFVLEQATAIIERENLDPNCNAFVLNGENWHEGVLGIIASKLQRQYHKPIVVLSESNGILKGSARSIKGIDIHRVLSSCAPLLEKFGGHNMAAGLTLRSENLTAFKTLFEKTIREVSTSYDFTEQLEIDCTVSLDRIKESLINEIEWLEPYGSGNPQPLFMASDIVVVNASLMGKQHFRLTLCQAGAMNIKINAVKFNASAKYPLPRRFEKIAYRLGWNRWNGSKKAQIIIEAAYPEI